MKARYYAVVAAGLALIAATRSAGASESQQQLDANRREIRAMHWATGSKALADSHGKFVAPPGATMLSGVEAARFDEIINGTDQSDSEGIVRLPR